MIRFDDYPYAQVREACTTVLGRVGLVVLAALGGSMAGGVTATHSLAGLWLGFVGLPGFSLASLVYGAGIFVLPLLLLYAIASIRCEWPLRLTVICFFLMWWNIHQTIRWSMYDGPMAKQAEKMEAMLDKAIEEGQKKRQE